LCVFGHGGDSLDTTIFADDHDHSGMIISKTVLFASCVCGDGWRALFVFDGWGLLVVFLSHLLLVVEICSCRRKTFASIRCNVEWPQSTANKSYVVCT
jgi:hypothetical protein